MDATYCEESSTEKLFSCTCAFVCPHKNCDKKFQTPQALKTHSDLPHNEWTQHRCADCDKWFRLYDFDNHMRDLHSREPLFACLHENCDKELQNRRNQKKHYDLPHNEETQYCCAHCEKWFRLDDFDNHMKNLHGRDPLFVCPHKNCDKEFQNRQNLKRHSDLPHNEWTQHRCADCDKWFRLTEFCYHMKNLHGRDPLFVCPHENCDKEFRDRRKLKKHYNLPHNEETQYCCPECKKWIRFIDCSSHMENIHNRDVLFVCADENCDKEFKHPWELRRHITDIHYEEMDSKKQGPGGFKICNTFTPREQSLIKMSANIQVASQQDLEATNKMTERHLLQIPSPSSTFGPLPSFPELMKELEKPGALSESGFHNIGVFNGSFRHLLSSGPPFAV